MVENDLKIPFLWAAAYLCYCQGNILIWCQMVEFFKTSHILFSLPPCNIYYFYISMWSLCTAIKRISYDLNSRLFWFNALLCCYCLCKKLIGSINVQLPKLSILLPSSAQPHLSYMGLTLISMPLSLLFFFLSLLLARVKSGPPQAPFSVRPSMAQATCDQPVYSSESYLEPSSCMWDRIVFLES